jgi:diaminopimelate epimerase
VIDVRAGQTLAPGAFCKYHALGNDYLVMDPGPGAPELMSAWVAAVCHRHTGIGADGILVIGPGDAHCDAHLTIYNPDGSQAEKSGNGLRIFARALYDCGYVVRSHMRIRVGQEVVTAQLALSDDSPQKVADITVAMGTPTLTAAAMGMSGAPRPTLHESLQVDDTHLDVTAVSMGNPHCVVFVDTLNVAQLRALGPRIENHPTFLRRTNVQLAKVISRSEIHILIWERGAGETSASGSSSCAVVAAARARNEVDDHVAVVSPGGTLFITADEQGSLHLRGPVQAVCRGVWLGPQ